MSHRPIDCLELLPSLITCKILQPTPRTAGISLVKINCLNHGFQRRKRLSKQLWSGPQISERIHNLTGDGNTKHFVGFSLIFEIESGGTESQEYLAKYFYTCHFACQLDFIYDAKIMLSSSFINSTEVQGCIISSVVFQFLTFQHPSH